MALDYRRLRAVTAREIGAALLRDGFKLALQVFLDDQHGNTTIPISSRFQGIQRNRKVNTAG
jgi:hypothetical protein